jgi:hypothetical protein
MSFPFNAIDPSAAGQAAFTEWVPATRRARGALRYRCPTTGSYVLLTDPAALAGLSAAHAPVRCASCGETHHLTVDDPLPGIVRPQTTA